MAGAAQDFLMPEMDTVENPECHGTWFLTSQIRPGRFVFGYHLQQEYRSECDFCPPEAFPDKSLMGTSPAFSRLKPPRRLQ
jgi:hypothetical protein